jgi:DNA-binding response OmpR family regulator
MNHDITSRPSLLIVESDRALLERLARHFSVRGFAVTAVHHPRQALAVVAQRGCDQAVLGRTLPEFDSTRLAEMLKRRLGEVRIIMLAELDDAALHDEALEAGVDAVLPSDGRLSDLEELLAPAGISN